MKPIYFKQMLLYCVCIFLIVSCKNHNSLIPHYEGVMHCHVSMTLDGEYNIIFIPIIEDIPMSPQDGKTDTLILFTYNHSLYNDLSIKTIPEDRFLEQIYSCLKEGSVIRVSPTFLMQHTNNIVHQIDSINESFNAYGKDWLISQLSSYNIDKMYKDKYEAFKYLAYLCWENGIYIGTNDETGEWTITTE